MVWYIPLWYQYVLYGMVWDGISYIPLPSAVCTIHSTQYTVHSTQYTVHSTQYHTPLRRPALATDGERRGPRQEHAPAPSHRRLCGLRTLASNPRDADWPAQDVLLHEERASGSERTRGRERETSRQAREMESEARICYYVCTPYRTPYMLYQHTAIIAASSRGGMVMGVRRPSGRVVTRRCEA